MRRLSLLVLAGALPLLALLPAAGQAPPGHALAVEAVGDRHYFHVRFDRPAGLFRPGLATPGWWEEVAPDPTPRLVPEGDAARLVCTVPSDAGLEFVGRYDPKAEAVKARLLYPVAGDRPGSADWKSVPVVLDVAAARRGDGLAKKWAAAQVGQFEDLSARTGEFGFYSFAATATARRHGLPAPKPLPGQAARFDFSPARLYELTTGATAITESLQLRRMTAGPARAEERAVPVASLPGIDIREHPWEKMMAGQKPADEPLARLVPHDNYFVTFRDPAKLVEFADLLTLWGGNLTRSFEFTSRDYRLWERYERQLALDAAALARGDLGIRGVAVTGNDAYLRDGTDVTVLFQTDDPKALLAALDAGVAAARKRHGAKLVSTRADGVESHVAPLREVSVHRVVVGGVVVVSNSPAGLRRVRDAAEGKAKRLADSLDFRYMRVVFRADDKVEDGFLYLPDAFIRKFVGPESRIKQKRRLEALAGLHLMTHGALLAAWETGKLPASAAELYRLSGLKPDEVAVLDGPIDWDADRGAAVSEVYGSIHFATPLVELAIDKVTAEEARGYADFRQGYLRLWRRFFDPVGMRLRLRGGEVKIETYVLPLIESEFYGSLRDLTGNGTAKLDPASISPRALLQYTMHLDLARLSSLPWDPVQAGVGERLYLRLDDGPEVARLLDPKEWDLNLEREPLARLARTLSGLPLAVGVEAKDPKRLADTLWQLRPLLPLVLHGWKVTFASRRHNQVTVEQVELTHDETKVAAVVSYAFFGGCLHATFSAAMMDRLIDEDQAKRPKGDPVEINSSLYAAPSAAGVTRPALDRLVETATRHEARAGLALWYAVHRCGLGGADADPAEAAFRVLGFVPIAPDRTGYRYDRAADEVVNDRHGSFRQPAQPAGLAESSPVFRLLQNVESVRGDLRFREDGIHTTLTLDRSYSPDRLAAMAPEAKAALVSELAGRLTTPDRFDRGRAAGLLGKVGPDAKAAVPALQFALFDTSAEVRATAESALTKIDPAAGKLAGFDPRRRADLLPALTAGLKSEDVDVYEWAFDGLQRLQPEKRPTLRDGLIAALGSKEAAIRRWAAERLGRLGAESRSALPQLLDAVTDPSGAVQVAAVVALQAIGTDPPRPDDLPRLTRALRSGQAPVRAWATEQIVRVGPEAKAVVPALLDVLSDADPEVGADAIRLARALDGDRVNALATERLSLALRNPDKRKRDWALGVLRSFGPDEPPVKAALLAGLTEALRSRDAATRSWAVGTLAGFGPAAKPFVPQLIRVLDNDDNFDVRVAAKNAIIALDPATARKEGLLK